MLTSSHIVPHFPSKTSIVSLSFPYLPVQFMAMSHDPTTRHVPRNPPEAPLLWAGHSRARKERRPRNAPGPWRWSTPANHWGILGEMGDNHLENDVYIICWVNGKCFIHGEEWLVIYNTYIYICLRVCVCNIYIHMLYINNNGSY